MRSGSHQRTRVCPVLAWRRRCERDQTTAPTTLFDEPLRPNGIALDAEGRLLMAHLGASSGAIFSLSADGETAVVVDTVEGEPMPPANFVVTDSAGRVWITVSDTACQFCGYRLCRARVDYGQYAPDAALARLSQRGCHGLYCRCRARRTRRAHCR